MSICETSEHLLNSTQAAGRAVALRLPTRCTHLLGLLALLLSIVPPFASAQEAPPATAAPATPETPAKVTRSYPMAG